MSWPQGEQGTKSPRAVCAFAQAGDRVSESGMEEAGPMLTWALAGVWGIRESLLGEQLSRRDPRMAGVRRVSEAHQEEHFYKHPEAEGTGPPRKHGRGATA